MTMMNRRSLLAAACSPQAVQPPHFPALPPLCLPRLPPTR